MDKGKSGRVVQGSLLGALAFYFLIALEFVYMAGPFAVYFYSIYSPVLNFFNRSPALAWLISFFLPHSARETSSFFINALPVIGTILAAAGFLAFCMGACQVYYHKLAKKGIVARGIYSRIRHPQYASFIVCSFGLLIIWPRYIVAVMFVTMLFFYYLLAKLEEAECERKFGQSYVEYKTRTSMFFPFKLSFLPKLPKHRGRKIAALICSYVITLAAILGAAKGLNVLVIDSLYATSTNNSVNVALCEISDEKINEAVYVALSDKAAAEKLSVYGSGAKFINYVLPAEWFSAEIPMNGIEYRRGHDSPADYNRDLYKVIFTKANMRDGAEAEGRMILTSVVSREPIAEVWVNLSSRSVVRVLDMPDRIKYQGIPVAVY